jgi:hypothetical protein
MTVLAHEWRSPRGAALRVQFAVRVDCALMCAPRAGREPPTIT